jgi:uncharacterized OsmC-like protein
MATSTVEYLGGLSTKCTHIKSGKTIITDAPIDNNGKGDSFSPTDLVATAYASCMITIIGIYCEKNDIDFTHCNAEVIKEMSSAPRAIGKLSIHLNFKGNDWSKEIQSKIINAGENCPVAKTVHDNVELEFKYDF